MILKLCSAFHNDTRLRADDFQFWDIGRDSLKEFCLLFASSDDRRSTRQFFLANDVPFDFVSHVRVCLGESPAAERFCYLMNI